DRRQGALRGALHRRRGPGRGRLSLRRHGLGLARLERGRRRALEDAAVDVEARAVAWAVPAALGGVEAQQAAEVRAAQRDGVQRAVVVAEDALLGDRADDPRLARGDVVGRLGLAGLEAVDEEVGGEPCAELGYCGRSARRSEEHTSEL